MSAPVTVLVVDDHPMVAEGIEAILETWDGVTLVGTLSSAADAIAAVQELKPDVVLMDLNMPGMSGLSATEIILERRPQTRILILSMHDSDECVAAALSHGAVGYILKDVPTDEIKTAIDTVMSGERYICTGDLPSLAPATGVHQPLTSRERAILLELAQGRTNTDVANTLDISVRTVETHRKNIKRKLGISTSAGLTRYALEHGVLQGTGARERSTPVSSDA